MAIALTATRLLELLLICSWHLTKMQLCNHMNFILACAASAYDLLTRNQLGLVHAAGAVVDTVWIVERGSAASPRRVLGSLSSQNCGDLSVRRTFSLARTAHST